MNHRKGKENNVIFLTPLEASSVKAIANISFIPYFKQTKKCTIK